MHPALRDAAVPKPLLDLLNQVFEIEKKVERRDQPNSSARNVRKMRDLFDDGIFSQPDTGLLYHDPTGEPYDETRTDCEASIAGQGTEGLVITETVKPIVYLKAGPYKQIVQKAVVVVEAPPAASQDPITEDTVPSA